MTKAEQLYSKAKKELFKTIYPELDEFIAFLHNLYKEYEETDIRVVEHDNLAQPYTIQPEKRVEVLPELIEVVHLTYQMRFGSNIEILHTFLTPQEYLERLRDLRLRYIHQHISTHVKVLVLLHLLKDIDDYWVVLTKCGIARQYAIRVSDRIFAFCTW